MKIALVWNHRSRLLDCSFRFEQYLAGFRALGHRPVVVCDRASAEGFDGPLEVAEDAARFEDADFWRGVAADVAVIVTWHRMSAVLAALGDAGTRAVAIADTDGRLSLRVYPGAALERLMVYQNSAVARLQCFKYWLGRYLRESVRGSAEDREAVASTRASCAVVFGHWQGRLNFRRFLLRSGAPDLSDRLAVVPFAIGAAFLDCPVPETKDDRVVAIGRWDDPQKHPARLASALGRLLRERPGTEVVVFGCGAERFAPLARRYEALTVAGVQPQDAVARALAGARAIVFSSRWEGSPHAALEALALGATLVGPPIPSLASWTDDGRYGTVARSGSAASLARAIMIELAAWDAGAREPRRISGHWRSRLAPEVVCRRLLETLPGESAL